MNTSWEDQLTKYNDEEIEYDAIGNPIKIGNKTLTWTNGRQLKTLEQADRTINYFYNKDGIRVGKNSSGILCEYYLEGSNIVLEKRYTDMIYYIRDDVGSLIGMKYKDKMYYYIKNLQEDIIGIMDAGFNRVATYEYDAWGRILSIRDELGEEIKDEYHIARINPFRYRSYYYDEESGLYYLKSRYYNPVWGRFLNVDINLGINKSFLGYNLYGYVDNRPTNFSDDTGTSLKSFLRNVFKKAKKVISSIASIVGYSYKRTLITGEKNADSKYIKATVSRSYNISTPTKPIDIYSNTTIRNSKAEVSYGVNLGVKNVSVGIEASENGIGLQASFKNTSIQFAYNIDEEDFFNSSYSLTISQSSSFGNSIDLNIEINQFAFFVICLAPVPAVNFFSKVKDSFEKAIIGFSKVLFS